MQQCYPSTLLTALRIPPSAPRLKRSTFLEATALEAAAIEATFPDATALKAPPVEAAFAEATVPEASLAGVDSSRQLRS